MTLQTFPVPQNQYLSLPFINWSRLHERPGQARQARLMFTMARYALFCGLRALGIVPGDEVLVPAYICSAVVDAIQACGALPVFYRVGRDCSLDLEDAQRRISRRTRALMVVHYFGFPLDLKQARKLAGHHALYLIEDCAHVLPGTNDGTPLGSIGDISVFSWRKFLPTFDGAELVLNSSNVELQGLRRQPLVFDLKALKYMVDTSFGDRNNVLSRVAWQLPTSLFRLIRGGLVETSGRQGGTYVESNGSRFDPEFVHTTVTRTSELVLAHSDIPAIAAKRRHNYKELAERLAQIPGVHRLFPALPEDACPLHFPMFLSGVPGAHLRLRQLGIPATAWDGVRPAAVLDNCFPDAGFLYDNLVFLPVHQNLRPRHLDLISEAASTVYQQKANGRMSRTGVMDSQMASANGEPGIEQGKKQSARTIEEKSIARKRVLLIAFHFPPQMGSSGILRSLKYCHYLPEEGWLPTVLTVSPRAYERVDQSQINEIPKQVKVIRAFALDTRKHLSLNGAYLSYTALPDRWVTWCLGAVPAGLLQIRKDKIAVILSTFPIASAVLIGYFLHRITNVPWVADFRDSMTEDDYPSDPGTRRVLRWLEKKAVRHASRLIFTARSTMQMYLRRYPELSADKCLVIANGYDEQDFLRLSPVSDLHPTGRVRMHHSGVIYPKERNPIPFFMALSRLKKHGRISSSWFSVDLRASGNEEHYRDIINELGIEDLVHFLPALPYRQALEDSNQANILLLLQGASCDHQIPAKAYEYLRLNKPILALTSRTGDTATLLNECGGATIVDITDQDEIYRILPEILNAVRAGRHPLPKIEVVSTFSRQNQARELAQCLTGVVSGSAKGEGFNR